MGTGKRLWPEEYGQWPTPTLGLILGCGAITFPHTNTENDQENAKKAVKSKGAT